MNRAAYPISWSPGEQRLFDEANSFSPDELAQRAVDRIAVLHRASGYDELAMERCVSDGGASEGELAAMERRLGVSLPPQYRAFLLKWRYLVIQDGFDIWGPPRPNWEEPHVADFGIPGVGPILFCGRYHKEEDGDSLTLDIGHPDAPAWISLHGEARPFAPSFSHALWRITEMVVPAGYLQESIEHTRLEVQEHRRRNETGKQPWWKLW